MYYNQELGLCIEFGPVRVDSVRRGGGGPPPGSNPPCAGSRRRGLLPGLLVIACYLSFTPSSHCPSQPFRPASLTLTLCLNRIHFMSSRPITQPDQRSTRFSVRTHRSTRSSHRSPLPQMPRIKPSLQEALALKDLELAVATLCCLTGGRWEVLLKRVCGECFVWWTSSHVKRSQSFLCQVLKLFLVFVSEGAWYSL